jgi:hypothetical protein
LIVLPRRQHTRPDGGSGLKDARRRGNEADERLVLAWRDDEFVSRAHLRAEDREIKRLRRWLREAA